DYRDSFTLTPKDIIEDGCTYQSHEFKIERDGLTSYTGDIVGKTTSKAYTYSSYPNVIGVGTHVISMQIHSSCGDSGWIVSKTLTVNGPANNNPPTGTGGFVDPNNPTYILSQTMLGTRLDLIYMNDPSIPTPFDPDGDDVY